MKLAPPSERAGAVVSLGHFLPDDGYEPPTEYPDSSNGEGHPAAEIPGKSLKLTYFDDCGSFVEKRSILKGIIARGETSAWIAPPGAGKSALLTEISVHAAAQRDWRGHRATSESRKPAEGLSRRLMLAGLAILPTVPAAAAAVPTEVDPIFAAIAASREAQQEADRACARVTEVNKEARAKFGSDRRHYADCCAYVADILGADQDEFTAGPFDDAWEAHKAFAETEPTTLAGLFAMLIYADEEPEILADFGIIASVAAAARRLSVRGAA